MGTCLVTMLDTLMGSCLVLDLSMDTQMDHMCCLGHSSSQTKAMVYPGIPGDLGHLHHVGNISTQVHNRHQSHSHLRSNQEIHLLRFH